VERSPEQASAVDARRKPQRAIRIGDEGRMLPHLMVHTLGKPGGRPPLQGSGETP